MRIRILDRILVALAGLILVAACAGLVAQIFFGQDVGAFITRVLTTENTAGKILAGLFAVILLVLGVYCLMVLFRHRSRKDRFIMQKLESGDLAISLNTLETMVQKCLDQHSEIKTDSIQLENQRDGLLIRIRGTVAGGISIPLTVDTLQKQVKQYVTACSGVEVKGIRIQIESSGEDAVNAPFAIAPPTGVLLINGNEGQEAAEETGEGADKAGEEPEKAAAETENSAAETAQEPVKSGEGTAAAAAMAAAENLMKEIDEEEDDRPIHQRLFSTQEEPCIMPLPPENLNAETAEPAAEKDGKNTKEETDKDKSAGAGTPEGESSTAGADAKGEKDQ